MHTEQRQRAHTRMGSKARRPRAGYCSQGLFLADKILPLGNSNVPSVRVEYRHPTRV